MYCIHSNGYVFIGMCRTETLGVLKFCVGGYILLQWTPRVFVGKGNSTQLLLRRNDVINVNDVTRAK